MNMKKGFGGIIFAGIIIFLATVYLDKIILILSGVFYVANIGSATINDRILFITFWGLVWYAYETRIMRKTTQSQLELTQKQIKVDKTPLLNFYYKTKDKIDPKKYFRLRNVGQAVAYNIKFDNVFIEKTEFSFNFEDANSTLIPGEEKIINVEMENKNSIKMTTANPQEDFLHAILEDARKEKSLEEQTGIPFLFSCENAFGEKFECRWIVKQKLIFEAGAIKISFDKHE